MKPEQGSGQIEGLPLYRRKLVGITGISKFANNKAEVQYTWKAVPTELGETFDINGPFFKSLTPDQQAKLRQH